MAKKNLNFVEMHVEKAALGVGGLFVVGVLTYYMLFSPNTIEFDGKRVGGKQLDERLAQMAEDLDRRVKSAKEPEITVPKYHEQLSDQLSGSILKPPKDSPAPEMPAELPLAAAWGPVTPAGPSSGEDFGSVLLVTPLRPMQPAARTGRSMVVQSQAKLSGDPDDKGDPSEVAWVTVAAYWPRKAQDEALNNAKYPSRFAKSHIGRVEAERQELLPSGQWGEWKTVKPAKAMPEVDVPDPLMNSSGADITNRSAIDEVFERIRSAQLRILQPPFYPIKKGDEWKIPPIKGHEDVVEEDAPLIIKKEPPKDKKDKKPPPPTQDGPRGPGGKGTHGGPTGDSAPPTPKIDPAERRKATEALAEAKKLLAKGDFNGAKEKADEVINNPSAKKEDHDSAEKIVASAQAELDKQQVQSGPRGKGGRPETGGLDGTKAPPNQGTQAIESAMTVTDEDGNPAVWFHDDSVETGKTYRYRMRVALVNRFVGRLKSAQPVSAAKLALLPGEWSDPTDPVTVAPSARFYVGSAKQGDESTIRVEVFRWLKGKWIGENFEVRLGDIIGLPKDTEVDREAGKGGKAVKEKVDFTTGAVVIDVRPNDKVWVHSSVPGKPNEINAKEVPSVVITYVDPADGQVKEHVAAADRADPMLEKLKKEDKGG